MTYEESYWAERNNLVPTTIYSVDDKEVHLQVNFQYD